MSGSKRAFDIIATALGLLALAPLFALVAVLIKLGDGGPVFFRQARVGRHGRLFRMWKFRTMVVDAERCGPLLTVGCDPRVTPVGHWLRKTKIDELPQLFNVLRGEMSLVGPRPSVAKFVAAYTPEQAPILELTPGITDPASVAFINESEILSTAADPEAEYIERVMPVKVRLSLEYARRATLWSDVLVILTTLYRLGRAVARGLQGAPDADVNSPHPALGHVDPARVLRFGQAGRSRLVSISLTWAMAGILLLILAFGTPPSRSAPPRAPDRAVLAVHANRLEGKYVFRSRTWDLEQIRRVFNAVIVAAGDQDLVRAARAAGLAVYIQFDEKRDFAAGKDIAPTVRAVVAQVRANPGTIAGIRIADELNEALDPQTALAYLRATGGVLRREAPGVPVIVDVIDGELTCNQPGQRLCAQYLVGNSRYLRDYVLKMFYESGYVDGFFLSTSLRNFDPDVQARAWQKARAMFPQPFLLFNRTAQLSFSEPSYPHDAATARRQVAAHVSVPLLQGADGVDLWAWHRPWRDSLRTFLDKDGRANPLWDALVQAAREMGVHRP